MIFAVGLSHRWQLCLENDFTDSTAKTLEILHYIFYFLIFSSNLFSSSLGDFSDFFLIFFPYFFSLNLEKLPDLTLASL